MMRERKSTGIMMASQVCERFVLPQRPKLDGTNRHHSEVSNYFARPPATTTTTRYTVHEANAGSHAFTTQATPTPAPPPPPMAPLPNQVAPPAPTLQAAAFEPEPEPEPEKIYVAPETIASWGSWSRAELYEQACELGIKGRSKLTKRGLLKALVAYVCS